MCILICITGMGNSLPVRLHNGVSYFYVHEPSIRVDCEVLSNKA